MKNPDSREPGSALSRRNLSRRNAALAATAIMALAAGAAHADVTVGVADTNSAYPFNYNPISNEHVPTFDYYQIYSAKAFGVSEIGSLTFYPAFTYPYYVLYGDYQISLGVTDAPVGTDAIPTLTNVQTFFVGDLGSNHAGSTPFTIQGSTYDYDPSMGNLVMHVQVANQEFDPGDPFQSDDTGHATSRVYTIMGGDVNADGGGLVTTFGGAVSAAPEPASWALMILGFGGAGATLRRRRSAVLA